MTFAFHFLKTMSFNCIQQVGSDQCYSSGTYDESIDFSNACRSLYMNRVQRTEEYKNRLDNCSENKSEHQRKSSMDTAMERLGQEMVIKHNTSYICYND